MISLVIKGPTFEEAHQQISKALIDADLVELRLDYFTTLDLNALKILRSNFSIPMIFTLRSQLEGGSYSQSEENRLLDICRLIELKPEYLDLESHIPADFIKEISSRQRGVKIILSYHNFKETPRDLEEIYQEMQKIPASFYKIAVDATNCLDALRLMCWSKFKPNLIAISMGAHGQISRILGPIIGSPITYAALEEDEVLAPGQMLAKTLLWRYHHRLLNCDTKLYGLIGDPVDQSLSDETHNSLIRAFDLNAVYVKIQVNPSELSDFLRFAKELPFHGLSVTMPLKEEILKDIDETDPKSIEIGAVNTLLFKEGKILGFNTDGIGALNAIERLCPVKEKKIVIIGAGGAAKAIAFEAVQRGAFVTIINRDEKRAHEIANRLHCIGKGLDYLSTCTHYDILINCTPVSLPIDPLFILPETIVMDIKTKPKDTLFLKFAMEIDCRVIYGYQMFIEQALHQFDLWFKDSFDIQKGRKILEKHVLDCVLKP